MGGSSEGEVLVQSGVKNRFLASFIFLAFFLCSIF
jgi:hypothetical protein